MQTPETTGSQLQPYGDPESAARELVAQRLREVLEMNQPYDTGTARLRLAELDVTADGQRYHLRDLTIETDPEGLPDVVNALNRLGQRGNGEADGST